MKKSDQTITWLHLSDFHFRAHQDWQRDVVLSSLSRDVIDKLPEQGLTPDMVFLTGDRSCGSWTDWMRSPIKPSATVVQAQ